MSLVTTNLLQTLNGRLQDADAKQRDSAYEIQVLASIDKTAAAVTELGATEREVAGLFRFRERLAKQLIKKHKVTSEELEVKGDE